MAKKMTFEHRKWITTGIKDLPVEIIKNFNAENTEKASVVTACFGTFRIFINGKSITDDLFLPLNTDFEKRYNIEYGTEPFEERVGECTWEVALVIPTSAIFRHSVDSLDGKVMRANFYKCGDLLQTPHFLSWNQIDLPQPKFHCPEFFGEVMFE